MKVTRLRAEPAPGRRRHVRRRPSRPPGGHLRGRHRRDLRAAPGLGRRSGRRAAAADTVERKAELMGGLGVRRSSSSRSTRSSRPAAREFVDDVLVGALRAGTSAVGENFRFGHKATGDEELLRADDRFETRMVALLEVDGEMVSSSHIRGLVLGGAVEYARTLLGAPFTVAGEVPHGDERGRPSASRRRTSCPRGLLHPRARRLRVPRAHRRRRIARAATSVGVRPMFDSGLGELIEAFLVDFDGDLYDTPLGWSSSSACVGRSASSRSKRWWSRWAATWRLRGRSALTLLPFRRRYDTDTQNESASSSRSSARTTRTPGTRGCRSRCSPQRINHLTEHLRAHKKDHHSRRGLLMLVGQPPPAAELPPAQRPRGLPRRSSRSSGAARGSSIIAPGTPVARVLAQRPRTARALHAATTCRPDDASSSSTRSPSARSAPTSCRSTKRCCDGLRRAGRDAVRRLDRRLADARPRSARSSGSTIAHARRTSSPRARPRRRSAPTSARRHARHRALVIVGPDQTVQWSLDLATRPGILPGANLIFDGLAGAAA